MDDKELKEILGRLGLLVQSMKKRQRAIYGLITVIFVIVLLDFILHLW